MSNRALGNKALARLSSRLYPAGFFTTSSSMLFKLIQNLKTFDYRLERWRAVSGGEIQVLSGCDNERRREL